MAPGTFDRREPSPAQRIWIVRAGPRGTFIEDFRRNDLVAMGWSEVGDVPDRADEAAWKSLFACCYPSARPAARRSWIAQLRRFLYDIQIGDSIATYDSGAAVYLLGTVASDVAWRDAPLPRFRRVQWTHSIRRAALSAGARHGLGSITALFQASPTTGGEILARAEPIKDEPTL